MWKTKKTREKKHRRNNNNERKSHGKKRKQWNDRTTDILLMPLFIATLCTLYKDNASHISKCMKINSILPGEIKVAEKRLHVKTSNQTRWTVIKIRFYGSLCAVDVTVWYLCSLCCRLKYITIYTLTHRTSDKDRTELAETLKKHTVNAKTQLSST